MSSPVKYTLSVHSRGSLFFFSLRGIRWTAATVALKSQRLQTWANNWAACLSSSALWKSDKWLKHIPLIRQITCHLNSLQFALSHSLFGGGGKRNPHLFASEDVLGQFDLGEVAFADGFQEPVAADVGLLVCCGVGHVAAHPGLWVRVRLQRKREKKQFRPVFVFSNHSRPQFFNWEQLWRLNLNAQMGGLQSNALIISLSELGWFWLDRTVASRHLILTLSRHAEGGRDEEWGRKRKRLWKSRD